MLLRTSMGDITLELLPDKAPKTVANFLLYVNEGAFNDTIFHRVIPGFMVQGGGYFADLSEAREFDPVVNEADNGLSNLRGTVAMARDEKIDSAARQFFINVDDNTHLDHSPHSCTRDDEAEVEMARSRGLSKPLTCETYGYAVFARVVAGMDVVDDIELVETGFGEVFNDLPVETISIQSAKLKVDQP